MGKVFFRSVLFTICIVSGLITGPMFIPLDQSRLIGAGIGVLLFLVVFLLERTIGRTPPYILSGVSVGLVSSLVVLLLFQKAFSITGEHLSITLGAGAIILYLGTLIGSRAIRVFRIAPAKTGVGASTRPKILDTSALIDGRIADMVELGFVGGPLVVPQFVLNETQGIADSTDPLKRARGRRGLGIIEKLQSMDGIEVRLVDEDFPKIKAVDGKIVAMAKAKEATVVTNDFNLSKVAELQGVRVLNVHQLSHALRPVVLPGEQVRVTIQKAGKEPDQGVGYLEDGTMVVVEGGEKQMNSSIEAVVTSVLQTSAGRMIFAQLPGEEVEEVKEKRRVWRRRG